MKNGAPGEIRTLASYRDALQIFLSFATNTTRTGPSRSRATRHQRSFGPALISQRRQQASSSDVHTQPSVCKTSLKSKSSSLDWVRYSGLATADVRWPAHRGSPFFRSAQRRPTSEWRPDLSPPLSRAAPMSAASLPPGRFSKAHSMAACRLVPTISTKTTYLLLEGNKSSTWRCVSIAPASMYAFKRMAPS